MAVRDVVALYGQLAATVAGMLELARALRWSQLPVLDARCSELFARLRETDLPAGSLSAPERERLDALTLRIHEDRDALAALLRPQFQHLMRRMYELHGGR